MGLYAPIRGVKIRWIVLLCRTVSPNRNRTVGGGVGVGGVGGGRLVVIVIFFKKAAKKLLN